LGVHDDYRQALDLTGCVKRLERDRPERSGPHALLEIANENAVRLVVDRFPRDRLRFILRDGRRR
jgi:hypothetical protein